MSILYNEIDPFACAWMRNAMDRELIAKGVVNESDVRTIGFEHLHHKPIQFHAFAGIGIWSHALRMADWPDDLPAWTGSCPCQPFSQAGRRKGIDDERHLWPAWFDLIRRHRPPIVFGEQVASPDGLRWLDAVFADLEGAGYACEAVDLCAASVGAPHMRQRLFFVAFADVQRCQGLGVQLRERRSRASVLEARGSGSAHVVGDSSGARSGRHPRGLPRPKEEGDRRWLEAGSVADVPELAGATRGFWSGADWIHCQDAKLRPIEPGTFPLADGADARMGRLRAHGNQIVPQVAAVFIASVMDLLVEMASKEHGKDGES
jgi:DNA (cytosine-5)-methyltransferase 1